MAAIGDKGVNPKSDCLEGKTILLGICGGIAATQSIKIARELRRHGADLSVIMTESAKKIITPLAIEWAADTNVTQSWDSNMSQLEDYDAVLVCPATRNVLANHKHGIMSSPLLMALSSARSRNVPIVFAPSMHTDLFNDPITEELEKELVKSGCKFLWGDKEEGKRKQKSAVGLVADFCNIVNRNQNLTKNIVVTLGATRSSIDDIRFVQNTSTGKTGWGIACDLYRRGHEITVVAGITTSHPEFEIPLIIFAPEPEEMLAELVALSSCEIDVWIHCAAVLDYISQDIHDGKIPSGDDKLQINLIKSTKHILELKDRCNGAIRIGFKLESVVDDDELLRKAKNQILEAGMTAVIANRLEDLSSNNLRGYLVDNEDNIIKLEDSAALECELRRLIK